MLGFGSVGASADTLFTTTSHTTPVSIGSTATATSGTVTAIRDGTTVNTCAASTLSLELEQNSSTVVSGTFTSGAFTGCFLSAAGDFPWRFTIRGSGHQIGNPPGTRFTNVTWDDVSATLWGVSAGDGTLTDATSVLGADGASVREGQNDGSSICFELSNAGTLSGPLLDDGKVSANYCLEGAAATAWSLGPTRIPAGQATLFTSPAHTARVEVGTTARLTGQATFDVTFQQTPSAPCEASTLTFRLTQNSDAGGVVGTITSGSFSGCAGGYTVTPTGFPWTVSITGNRIVSGATTAFPNTRLTGFALDYSTGIGLISGNLTSAASTLVGAYASQPVAGASPICLTLNEANEVTVLGSLLFQVDGRFCVVGAPASTWSLT